MFETVQRPAVSANATDYLRPRNSARILAALTIFLILSATVVFFSGIIETLGNNIPQQDLTTDYAIALFWALALGASILIWPVPGTVKKALLILWSAKMLVVLVAMLVYEAYYPFLDAYSYFNVPREDDYEWAGFSVGQGTENIYSAVWLYYKIMPESYHALKASFAVLGLIAVYIFYRAAVIFLGRDDVRILYALGLFPSVLFWSSIIGKDPLVLLAIALYVLGVVGWYRLNRVRYLLIGIGGIAMAVLVRSWLGPIMMAPLLLLLLLRVRGPLTKTVLAVLGSVALLTLTKGLLSDFGLESYTEVLVTIDTIARLWSEHGGSGQEISWDLTDISQVLSFVPVGMFTALFRPLPGEVLNPFGWLAGVENAVLLVLCGRAVLRTRFHELRDPIVLWAASLVIVWAVVYGFVSYQNLGTAVRFKLQILPVLLGLLLYLGRCHCRLKGSDGAL